MAAAQPVHVTLVANTPATVTLDKDYKSIDVCNVDGAAAVYFTVDGSTPTVAGTGTWVLPAVICSMEMTPRDDGDPHSGPTVVKLISTGTPKVSVSGL